jgi:diaminopimelate decarboxylase
VSFFSYQADGALYAEGVPLSDVAAKHGTPCYVYSRAAIESRYREFSAACAGRDAEICYAVKANSNLAVLNVLARLGSGFDIVSGGELERVLAAGGAARKTVFSGVGKTAAEMRAALDAGILCFNVESESELERLSAVATAMRKTAPVSLRVNPDVDAKTHPYVATGLRDNKFGVPYEEAPRLYRKAAALPGLRVDGIDCHIGSQLTEVEPFVAALERMLEFVDMLEATGMPMRHIDIGGGLGIRYRDEQPPPVRDYVGRLLERVGARKLKVLLEPGRALVGNAGVLLTRVEYVKRTPARNFIVVDAAMNDLVRPALYESWHDVAPVRKTAKTAPANADYDVVGPICESGDFLARDRRLAAAEGDLLAIMSAGAYGMTMSSNYNSRPRAAEVMVDGTAAHLVRLRENVADLFASERVLP